MGSENTLFDTIRQSGIELMQGPDDLIERIVCECATFLNEFRSAGLGRHILDIFDTMIGNIVSNGFLSKHLFIAPHHCSSPSMSLGRKPWDAGFRMSVDHA